MYFAQRSLKPMLDTGAVFHGLPVLSVVRWEIRGVTELSTRMAIECQGDSRSEPTMLDG